MWPKERMLDCLVLTARQMGHIKRSDRSNPISSCAGVGEKHLADLWNIECVRDVISESGAEQCRVQFELENRQRLTGGEFRFRHHKSAYEAAVLVDAAQVD